MHKIDQLLLKGKIIHLVPQNIRVKTDNAISRTSLLHEGRGNKMENNSVTRSSTNTSTSPAMTDTPSKAQGIAMITTFMFESTIIVMGNMLVIILFAREKKLRKKSLFLVMNMALADVMLGAVALPLYVYLIVGPYYQLWTAKAAHEFIFYFLDTTFSQSSLISAGFISCERFYVVF